MELADGARVLAYCANPGAFTGCLKKGSPTLLWDSKDPERKRRLTWKAIKIGRIWVGTDTHLANRLAEQALRRQVFPSLVNYEFLESERRIKAGLRMDFVLSGKQGACFVEVISATVVENGVARFPDSVTPRGLKHLEGLTRLARKGHRAVLLFVVQRNDVDSVTVSRAHHPAYAAAFRRALKAGVEALAFAVKVSPEGFDYPRVLPVNGDT